MRTGLGGCRFAAGECQGAPGYRVGVVQGGNRRGGSFGSAGVRRGPSRCAALPFVMAHAAKHFAHGSSAQPAPCYRRRHFGGLLVKEPA